MILNNTDQLIGAIMSAFWHESQSGFNVLNPEIKLNVNINDGGAFYKINLTWVCGAFDNITDDYWFKLLKTDTVETLCKSVADANQFIYNSIRTNADVS